VAAVTKNKYLVDLLLEKSKELGIFATIKSEPQFNYPLYLLEKDGCFKSINEKEIPKIFNKKNFGSTLYTIKDSFFPEKILNDEMGRISHTHIDDSY
jgi:hypothetical protein